MATGTSFKSFEKELNRLVGIFERNLAELKSADYVEAKLREDFLNPFFRALGWDMENQAGLIQSKREVEIESRTQIQGRQKRADYLFRADGRDRFVCEAKKPAEELHSQHAFQAKRYAWNKDLPVAILTDFEEFKIYIVGGRPHLDEPQVGEWKSWHFKQYPIIAQELWNLFARDRVAAGSIDQLIESLPKQPIGKGKTRQQWLIKPDRSRSLDVEFLNLLDEARRELASDLIRHNDRDDLLEGTKLNESIQRILDRILFLRICEDRDIDTGIRLDSIVDTWRRNFDKDEGRRAHQKPLELREEPPAYSGYSGICAPKDSLWRSIVRHFRALDRRPASHVPYFNGNLFKPNFCEELVVSDEWLAGFIADLSDEESPYLFNYIPVEILGTIYERFLGKIVRPQGKGATIEEKPEVRKAGGVYYTPRYIVQYIVGQTLGKLLENQNPEASLKLHVLDPACGSGSFLLRAFEVVCEHWQTWLMQHPEERKKKWCWVEPDTRDVHLTAALKRQILTSNIFGVDIDASAVEVTQLSLYLKMLENENRTTLQRQRELLPDDDDPLLPPLENNIKCFNSLIGSDFSVIPEDLVRVNAQDWNINFPAIIKSGGFDAVIGNPPYGADLSEEERRYFQLNYKISLTDTAALFLLLQKRLLKTHRLGGFVVPKPLLYNSNWEEVRDSILKELSLVCDCGKVWPEVKLEQVICVLEKNASQTKYISCAREGQKIHICAKMNKSLCAEFKFILSNVSPSEIALAQKFKSAGSYLGKILKNQRGAMLQSAVSASSGAFQVLGGKQIGRYGLAPLPKGRIAKAAVGDDKAFVKSNSILVQNIVAHIENPIDHIQIIATVLPDKDAGKFVILDTINQLAVQKPFAAQFVLGVLNSKLVNWFTYRFIFARAIRTMHFDAPVTDRIPLPSLDLKKPADKSRHDQMVKLVDKMLALMPKLRAAKSESERKTLQNAVTATDQQIDELVYELYGLTAKERKILEDSTSIINLPSRFAKQKREAKWEKQQELI